MEPIQNTQGVNGSQTDNEKYYAQKIADDLATVLEEFQKLDANHALADAPAFWAEICNAISQLNDDYTYALNLNIIPKADLDKMYNTFQTNVLDLQTSPSSQDTFQNVCQEALRGDTAPLHEFLDQLVTSKQIAVLEDILIPDTQNAEKLFQNYANTH